MPDRDTDWLGELRWRGYPRLDAVRDEAARIEAEDDPVARPRAPKVLPEVDPVRHAEVLRENEALRARVEEMSRLSSEFRRRLDETATAYEGAMLEADSRARSAELEHERLSGELESARAEIARLSLRDEAREVGLRLERDKFAAAEKNLLEARRKLEDAERAAQDLRDAAARREGALGELRRQAAAQNEFLAQSKALTDQDIRLLRQEMREFLAKFHRIQESFGEST